ncbi:MAG: ABC transporter permease, partial [Cyclobacteriaceae bacterium]
MNPKKVYPPKWPIRFLRLILRADYSEEIQGDMEEVFYDNLEEGTEMKARWLFVLDTLKLIRPNLLRNSKWILQLNFIAMTINNLKIAFRTLLKYKTHSAINLIGLAIGLTIGGFITLYVSDELSFDKFHENGNRIFKVTSFNDKGGRMETNAWPIGYKLKTEFPGVEAVVYSRTADRSLKLKQNNKSIDHKIHYVSEDFFNIFSFDLIEGDPKTALKDPYSVVITESMKQIYFDDQNVVGKTMTFRDTIDFKITGVVKEIPRNSHVQFDMLFSFSTYEKLAEWFSYTEGWGNFNVRNYVLLKENADAIATEQKAEGLYVENVGDWLEEMGITMYVDFIPMEEIYLKSGVHNSFGPSGSEDQVKTVSMIAIFALLLACINYINLSTARSANRAKEVGIKKVTGSSRLSLISQFLMESYLLTFIAFLISIVMMYLLLPYFNELIDRNYLIADFLNPKFVFSILALGFIIALLAGYYPAWVISGFKPLVAIKGNMNINTKGLGLRKTLIIFQFFISAGLLLATFLVLSQINFMREQDLGFAKEQILVVDAVNSKTRASHTTYKTELERLTSVQS